jgi:rare lipoprotein A
MKIIEIGIVIVTALLSVSCGSLRVQATYQGEASWYSRATNSPRGTGITASGIALQDHGYTAAHKQLPFGTKVRVTNLANGKSETLTITDRGPYVSGRIIDVTVGSAQRLGFYSSGVAPCKVEVLAPHRRTAKL